MHAVLHLEHEGADATLEHALEQAHAQPRGVGVAADDSGRQLLLVADQHHLAAALGEGHAHGGLCGLRGLVDEARLEAEALQDVTARTGARGTDHLGAAQHPVDGLVLLVLAPVAPRLDACDALHHVLHEVLAHRLGATDARHPDAGAGQAVHQVVHRDVAVGGAQDGARAGAQPHLHQRHGGVGLTGTGGSLDQCHALEQGSLERVGLALVHVAHGLQVHGLIDHALALHGVQVLVLLRRAHVRDGVVARLGSVPATDQDVTDGDVHARLVAVALLHLHHVLQRVELAQERCAVSQLVDAPPAAAHARRLRPVAPDELH
mmetsp:Transcript_37482/g.92750  ORF Transcript_37482/g.92750 Transcript_37482/m.92750 type:complete len:320 (+) Transcript_37482:1410-2369(+)